MRPLKAVALLCLVLAANAYPENIEEVKELAQSKDLVVEAEESDPQARIERCTTCSGNLKLKGPNDILAAIQALPGAEVHTQQSFEECSSDKGCAGIKVKDGAVVQRFGNTDAFKAAAAADTGNEFTFHAAGSLGNGVLGAAPFWWMNQNSPFQNVDGNFKEYSKSSQSSYSNTGPSGVSVDLAANPFLNGGFSKVAGGFSGGQETKPSTFQSSSFESSSFSTSGKGGVDLSKNPFLNGGVKLGQGFQGQGFQAGAGSAGSTGSGQAAFGQQGFSSQSGFNTGKFSSSGSSGYTGSSPSPFTASTGGSNINLIQNSQKTSELDFESQQTQQNIDEAFQGTGNVHAHEHSGGELQQTCAGQGYVCVHKAQCNNGVVNTNGANILQARTKKQYCNIKTEICCRIEVSTLSGAGGLQGSLGVGSATYSGQGSQQGSGIFVSGQSGQGSSQFGQSGQSGQSGQAGQSGSFGGNTNAFGSSSSSSTSSVNRATFGQGTTNQGAFANGGRTQGSFGATTGSGFNGQASFGSGTGSANRGVSVESSQSSFESSRGGQAFGNSNGGKFGASGTFSGTSFGSTTPTSRFGANSNSINNNEVSYKQTSQSNFIETDSFSAGSENAGVYRPGQGNGLKPGIPYLPPLDNTNSGSNVISSTVYPTTFITTPRPFTTTKPTYLPPPPSTSAPGYLPPVEGEQSILTETRLPQPTYNEGEIILDESRQPNRPKPTPRPTPRQPVQQTVPEIPSGCAAALKCTPIEYCTAEGVISNSTVALTRDQETYRVPLTDCKDLETGRVGKCCRDPTYTDPWPTNQLGKWVPGVFGGNDGKYVADSRGSGNNPRPQVTARPPVDGSVLLNNFRTPKPTTTPYGPNQVTPGYPTSTSQQGSFTKGQGQYSVGGRGQFSQGGQGQYSQGGQGQFTQRGQGQYSQGGQVQIGIAGQAQGGQGQFTQGAEFTSQTSQSSYGQKGQGQIITTGQGQIVTQGQGQGVRQGQGQYTSQGQGQIVTQDRGQFSQGGRGQFATGGQGQLGVQGQGGQFSQSSQSKFSQTSQGQGVITGQGQGVITGQGQGVITGQGQGVITGQGQGVVTGQGQGVITGQGQAVSQGFGGGFRQGSGFTVSQGGGFGIENEYSESVQRVFLQRYNGNGQCGILNGQKPFGNRNENEVDFAEIPWQAMVLLQTNKSLLCGGVITRPDVVITSASCVDGLNAKNVLIKGGEWKLGIDDEPLPFQIVQVKNILRHPFYKRGSANFDAAILVLSENLRLAKNIYPICLPRADETLDAFYNGAGECVVTGWGKQVLQAHLAGSIMHSINVSLINPGECQAKLSQDYPHLLSQYDQESCACGQPTNPVNNICRVDIGSALACTTDDRHYVLRGVYSWDSGCQPGNQLAAFYKFDVEWYEWAIGLIESVRFAQFSGGSQVTQNRFSGQIKGSQFSSGVKGGTKGGFASKGQFGQFGQGQIVSGGQGALVSGGQGQLVSSGQGQLISGGRGQIVSGGQGALISGGQSQLVSSGQGQLISGGRGQLVSGGQGALISGGLGLVSSGRGQIVSGGQGALISGGQGQLASGGQGFSTSGQFGQFSSGKYSSGEGFGAQIKAPITNSFSASYTEKKVFQSEPKIVTYTTKPEIVTFTTKPEYFTYTTKPKIVTYTTKPQIITYETSGSGTNPQYAIPESSFKPTFSDVTKSHVHSANCKCDGKK